MALSLTINIDSAKLGVSLRNVIQKIIGIFIRKVTDAMLVAMQRVIVYNARPSRRGNPPYSKTGRLVRSFRAVHTRRMGKIYGVSYGRTLVRDLDRDYVTAAWMKVRPQLNNLLSEAAREAQR